MSEFTYYYSKQLRSYEVQFAAIFGGMEVEVGKQNDVSPHLIPVPIKNASQDRVVGAIKGDNTQNKVIRLPLITYQLTGLEMSPDLRKGIGTNRRNKYIPTGGLIPTDIKVVKQRMPIPYRAKFELSVWASNKDQHNQIIEPILSIFDPQIQIQVSDDVLDWTRITTVELMDVRLGENIPMGTDRRVVQTVLTFEVPIQLSVPATVRNNIIEKIFLRIGAVANNINTSVDVLDNLDSQGIEYNKVFDAANSTIK